MDPRTWRLGPWDPTGHANTIVGVVANLGASRPRLGQRYGARRVSVFLYPGYLCVPKTLIAPDARAGRDDHSVAYDRWLLGL
jgi:hypothetical protein